MVDYGQRSGGNGMDSSWTRHAPCAISLTKQQTTSFAAFLGLPRRSTSARFFPARLVAAGSGYTTAGPPAKFRLASAACVVVSVEGKELSHLRPQVLDAARAALLHPRRGERLDRCGLRMSSVAHSYGCLIPCCAPPSPCRAISYLVSTTLLPHH